MIDRSVYNLPKELEQRLPRLLVYISIYFIYYIYIVIKLDYCSG